LQSNYPDPVTIFSSDLERVIQTAEPYLSATGRAPEFDKRLREVDTGAWSGLLIDEAARRFPEEFAAFRGGADIARGGGETFAMMRTRVGEALRDIARRTIDAAPTNGIPTALIFTHGGPIQVAVAEALGLPQNGWRLLEPVINCSLTGLTAVVGPTGDTEVMRLASFNAVYPKNSLS
jgi:probable phosphoglycerate mutase